MINADTKECQDLIANIKGLLLQLRGDPDLDESINGNITRDRKRLGELWRKVVGPLGRDGTAEAKALEKEIFNEASKAR